ncbi:MAG: hypothetical protein V1904_01860 [Bacteroidota bacterium]
MVLLIFVVFVLLCLGVDAIVQFRRHKKAVVKEVAYTFPKFFSENTIVVPKGLYFDKTHTWAFMDSDGMVKIGIDDFFPHVTGQLTSIKMKDSGEMIKKNEVFLTVIQNGKQLKIKAPVSGTIKAQNKALLTNTSLINSFPYSDGWVYMIEPTNWIREIQFLFMAEKFSDWLRTEFTRLRDFFAVMQKTNETMYAHVILQDGGELKEGILMDLRSEVWEDFQTHFIDTVK